jgi:hypothetical protein
MTRPAEIDRLARLMEAQEPPVLVIVGAGVSFGATGADHAKWQGLLEHGLRRLGAISGEAEAHTKGLIAKLERAFNPFTQDTVLDFADKITTDFRLTHHEAYDNWLRDSVGQLKCRPDNNSRATLEAIRVLQREGALIATTNYDSLLKDVTNTPVVTWEDQNAVFKFINRDCPGILHIHGHWERPSSVVLGRQSYDGVIKADAFQEELRRLWSNTSWLYLGTGNGMADPHFQRLLSWSKRWVPVARTDYFFTSKEVQKDEEPKPTPKYPKNVLRFEYEKHDALPDLLTLITPSPWPFLAINDPLLYRLPGSERSVPLPSYEEYVDGLVPKFEIDKTVHDRLNEHGWAVVFDVASIGKTSLAFRIAHGFERAGGRAYYIDLAKGLPSASEVIAVCQRLLRPGWFVVIDNLNREPELAKEIYDLWNARKNGCEVLFVGTHRQGPILNKASAAIEFFTNHPSNRTIEYRPSTADFAAITRHLYRQYAGPTAPPLPVVPEGVLETWHSQFEAALTFFCPAALSRLGHFQLGVWELSAADAVEWVYKDWLAPLDEPSLENLICIAAFGSQDLEMEVDDPALPYPGNVSDLGMFISHNSHGDTGQFKRYVLKEAGWSELILQASTTEGKNALLQAATKYTSTFAALYSRLGNLGETSLKIELIEYLETHQTRWPAFLFDTSLAYATFNLTNVRRYCSPDFNIRTWTEIVGSTSMVTKAMLNSKLHHIVDFLRIYNESSGDDAVLRGQLAANPQVLAQRAFETPLVNIITFIEMMADRVEVGKTIWTAFEENPSNLRIRAWRDQISEVATFIERASDRPTITKIIREAFEAEPNRFAARVWNEPLEGINSFLKLAAERPLLLAAVWDTLESDTPRLIARCWQHPLDAVASFIGAAKGHDSITTSIWSAIRGDIPRFMSKVIESPLEHLGAILGEAKRNGTILDLDDKFDECTELWKAKGMTASLSQLATFARHASDRMLGIVLSGVQAKHWSVLQHEQAFPGAAWLLNHCQRIGRHDLKEVLVELLLRRKAWVDFVPEAGGFPQACELIYATPASLGKELREWVAAVCNRVWLGRVMKAMSVADIAAGLRKLAFSPHKWIREYIRGTGLLVDCERRLQFFGVLESREQHWMVEFIGSASMNGWQIQQQLAISIHARLSRNGIETYTSHRPNVEYVEPSQWCFWIGLYAICNIVKKPLKVDKDLLQQTQRLWAGNVAFCKEHDLSMEQRVNERMLLWLEHCATQNPPMLILPQDALL